MGGIWKTKEPEKENSIISNLRADTKYEVQVTVRNMAGSADSKIVKSETDDGLPEPIPSWNIDVFTTESSITIQWPYPAVPNGDILSYRLSYSYWKSFLPVPPAEITDGPPFKVKSSFKFTVVETWSRQANILKIRLIKIWSIFQNFLLSLF